MGARGPGSGRDPELGENKTLKKNPPEAADRMWGLRDESKMTHEV